MCVHLCTLNLVLVQLSHIFYHTVNHCEFTYTLKHTELANYHIHAYSRFVLDWLVHLLALSLSFKKFEQE